MEEAAQKLHDMILGIYPDAVSVKVFVNCEGIQVIPLFRTNADGYSMRTITGKWIQKKEK